MHKTSCIPLNRERIFTVLDSAPYACLAICEKDQPYIIPVKFGWKFEDCRLWFVLYGEEIDERMPCLAKSNAKIALEFEQTCGNVVEFISIKGWITGMIEDECDSECQKNYVGLEVLAITVTGREYLMENDIGGCCDERYL